MFRRIVLTTGLVSACVWGLFLVARAANAAGAAPAATGHCAPKAMDCSRADTQDDEPVSSRL